MAWYRIEKEILKCVVYIFQGTCLNCAGVYIQMNTTSTFLCLLHFLGFLPWRNSNYTPPPNFEVCVVFTGCPRRNGQNFVRVFLRLNYTDITQNIYTQSWTVSEIMAIEKWGLVWFPRTVASVTPYTSTAHEIRNHPHKISSATGSLLVCAENCIATGWGHFEQVL